jgi:hypothetical protein
MVMVYLKLLQLYKLAGLTVCILCLSVFISGTVNSYARTCLFLVSVLYVHFCALHSHEGKVLVLVLAISLFLMLPAL